MAYQASKRGAENANREADEAALAEGEPVEPGLSDASIEHLKKLNELKEAGVLTPEEFEAEKQKILGA